MLEQIIYYSIHNKLVIILFTIGIIGFGIYALQNIPIGAVPDVTNNQVQVITTTRNLSTQDVEQFITYPVELEMANLPGVKEIRSISKFGLSVVTIVFEDRMGTYLPRQLIAEKIQSAEAKIPAGFGSPVMGPISTGLGEIFQYILDVKPQYKDRYSITDLRSIQDWIVKRQLSGIPGVVEVNTWGGKLKQYEVAINPNRLRAMNLTLPEIYSVLVKNNSVAGGGYIEKSNQSYFIRGEGLIGSLEDIEDIVIKNDQGIPIYIKDVAIVQFGYANRFGAITANGEGEKVLGQVMMLKNANSKEVIDRVKARVEQVQKSLPEGVYINPFLERSTLIAKTTGTIAENLILGCLIVIFVVILLLGSFRSGLVVASVIPLSLLFALSMMYLFGVDANLMSLGAIDFGIIIDGAVIIVEYVAFAITAQQNDLLRVSPREQSHLIDQTTYNGATKMMRSAIFGQLIIIIVFIPVLALTEVEGKMFRPMALTFCFALIGAIILCLTYIPVLSALVLRPEKPGTRNISARFIQFIKNLYEPAIKWALRIKPVVIGFGLALLIVAAYLFARMGGEFVPTLDEGDFVIQPVLKTGTTLSNTIETMAQIEKIVKAFPEVKQVVTRIGAAEIPTDPMSMEECDIIITLIPPSEWTTAQTKDELADAFKEALSVLPGVDYEFTQPIEMRFNELITGVRADLAIKIFGEDLGVLNDMAQDISQVIEKVKGAADISVEKVEGLPQMTVKYNRKNIARYGLNIEDVNRILTMNFAGLTAGSVFEGEKQFDLVVRYDVAYRKDIEDIRQSFIPLATGQQIPLSELADISYTKGPAKISRDDTKRRIVVGVNVRNRDLESVVEDVQSIINQQIKIPTGYNIAYGGQFENLRNARKRLGIAVPIALILIFVFLFFAFGSIKEALMVYTAIPLSAIGGIFLLYVRGMPFSISAGVGFIALFGIAVLNGIVLIEHFKELKAKGMTNLHERIVEGTKQRLRPVLLTATAAALGFLPMAVSTSAGAEVQRPLATVVIGGLISATLLTLFVLPVLYAIFDRPLQSASPLTKIAPSILSLLFACTPWNLSSQTVLSMESITQMALKRNAGLQAQQLNIARSQQSIPIQEEIGITSFYIEHDQINIAENGKPISVFGINQNFRLPGFYEDQRTLNQQKVALETQQLKLEEYQVRLGVAKAYQGILYWQAVKSNYQYLDSLYLQISNAASRRFETGETNYLEKITTETKHKEMVLQIQQCNDHIEAGYRVLNQWFQTDQEFEIESTPLIPLVVQEKTWNNHPKLQWYAAAQEVHAAQLKVEQNQSKPQFQVEYFLGTNTAPNARIYNGFQVGMGIPLWRKSLKARVQAAETSQSIVEQQFRNEAFKLKERHKQLLAQLRSFERALQFYEQEGQILAQEMIKTAGRAYQTGEIDFLQYLFTLENANRMDQNYLDHLIQYNWTVLDLNYLVN